MKFYIVYVKEIMYIMNITPDLPFLNIHNPFTKKRISVYLDKYSRMFLDTKDYLKTLLNGEL